MDFRPFSPKSLNFDFRSENVNFGVKIQTLSESFNIGFLERNSKFEFNLDFEFTYWSSKRFFRAMFNISYSVFLPQIPHWTQSVLTTLSRRKLWPRKFIVTSEFLFSRSDLLCRLWNANSLLNRFYSGIFFRKFIAELNFDGKS